MSQRRLPVYIVLDCSESMIGESIEAVRSGVDMLIRQLRSDPHALETAQVSIITYDASARQVLPLTDLSEVRTPALEVRPGTSLAKALDVLRECIAREVKVTTPDRKGDYRPIVFLLTDGQPTDDWESIRRSIDRLKRQRIANLYAIGCGDDVDFEVLQQVSDVVFRLRDVTPDTLKKLFIWLTASVQGASMGVGSADDAVGGVDLGKKPREIDAIAPGAAPIHDGPARQVFLKVQCTNVRRPYLVRYRLDEEAGGYRPIAAHPLETTFDEGPAVALPAINAATLMGCPPCPYCKNPSAGMCSCETLLCLPDGPDPTVLCPSCLRKITLGRGDGDFSINQSAG